MILFAILVLLALLALTVWDDAARLQARAAARTVAAPAERSARPVGPQPVFAFEQVSKAFARGGVRVPVFDRVSFAPPAAARLVGIQGPSGGGKTTALNLLAGLDVPDAGLVRVLGAPLGRGRRDLGAHRRRIGIVLQQQNLFAHLSARDNVAMPLVLHGVPSAHGKADRLLHSLGLAACADQKPAQLSGGQQQRVAIGKALAGDPCLLLADEPTSALDPQNAAQVLAALRRVVTDLGVAVVIVSHDQVVLAHCDCIVRCAEGRLGLQPDEAPPPSLPARASSPPVPAAPRPLPVDLAVLLPLLLPTSHERS